ncbi:hypothetical protein HY389_00065 [Candidatus Daviesbacteria bacterium]|nr:hypothetical protein [Candidatus Daviesbacteria bacterium]
MLKRINTYFSKHIRYSSAVHLIIGIGIGTLLANPVFNPHPLRWGIALIVVGLVGHLYAGIAKK